MNTVTVIDRELSNIFILRFIHSNIDHIITIRQGKLNKYSFLSLINSQLKLPSVCVVCVSLFT